MHDAAFHPWANTASSGIDIPWESLGSRGLRRGSSKARRMLSCSSLILHGMSPWRDEVLASRRGSPSTKLFFSALTVARHRRRAQPHSHRVTSQLSRRPTQSFDILKDLVDLLSHDRTSSVRTRKLGSTGSSFLHPRSTLIHDQTHVPIQSRSELWNGRTSFVTNYIVYIEVHIIWSLRSKVNFSWDSSLFFSHSTDNRENWENENEKYWERGRTRIKMACNLEDNQHLR